MKRVSSFVSRALSVFESHGILVTEKKKTVLCELDAAGRVFDAVSVYIKMRNDGVSVCLGTVQKVISLLLRFNLIVAITYGSRRQRLLRITQGEDLRPTSEAFTMSPQSLKTP